MLQQRVLRQVDCEMMDNLPLTANETASEMVLLENAHVDCALYVCNQNTPPPPMSLSASRRGMGGLSWAVSSKPPSPWYFIETVCCLTRAFDNFRLKKGETQ